MVIEVQMALPLVGEYWPRRDTGDFQSIRNVLYHYLGGSYTGIKCICMSCTLQNWVHDIPHLCMFYTLIFFVSFLEREFVCKPYPTPVPVTAPTGVSLLKIIWALTSKGEGFMEY